MNLDVKKLTMFILGAAAIAGAWWFLRGGAVGYDSLDIQALPEARPTETVELADGATYDLVMGYVRKSIAGTEHRMLAYNGSIPGPLFKIPQGAQVTLRFRNDTDMKTLLHSHGVRMDQAFDGAQTSQKEMVPGETFEYKLKFPDAGAFWYHPHVREDLQQELGLYGQFLIAPKDGQYWSPVNREVALFVDDIFIQNGRIPLDTRRADRTLMGRFGNVMLLNGETDITLDARRGEVVRFYFTNAANARPFRLRIGDLKMKLVGADGGAYERDQWVDFVTLGPSERAIIEVLFDRSGSFPIQHVTPVRSYALGTVRVGAENAVPSYASEFPVLRTHIETARSLVGVREAVDKAPDKILRLTLDMAGGMGHGGMGHGGAGGGIEWEDDMAMMNAMSNPESVRWKMVDQLTGKENMHITWTFRRGERIKIRITNDARSMHPMQHPIHFHGQRFVVLSRDGQPEEHLVWKDTAMLAAGETVDILLDTSNPGIWMAHCHIAEHLESGMMMQFKVE